MASASDEPLPLPRVRRFRFGAYGRVLRQPVLRRGLPGVLISAVGDGVRVVAVGAIVVGPALAGALTTLVGPGWVIGADAVTFAVLALSCRLAASRADPTVAPVPPEGTSTSGWRTILGQPRLLGLVAVTCVF